MDNDNSFNLGKNLFEWDVDEYVKHERSKGWYIKAIILALILLSFAFITMNYLFALIIIIAAIVMVLNDKKNPGKVTVTITTEGVIIGKNFYDYDEFKDFSIIYKPHLGIKNLYFEFQNVVKPRLSISLEDQNPLKIREELLKYLPEDLERKERPLSEELSNMFKI